LTGACFFAIAVEAEGLWDAIIPCRETKQGWVERMELAFAFFAEHAQQTSDGRINVLGLDTHQFHAPSFPVVLPSIFLVAKVVLDADERKVKHKFTAQMIGPDGGKLEPYIETEFVPPPPENPELTAAGTMVMQIAGMTFPAAGIYTFLISLDGKELKKIGIILKQLEQAPVAAQQ
jgi:hypothetical protein